MRKLFSLCFLMMAFAFSGTAQQKKTDVPLYTILEGKSIQWKTGTAGALGSGGYKSIQIAMTGIKPSREGEVEPYAVLSDDGLTVTFYYDGHMLSRKGVDIGYDSEKGQTSYATATTAVFDDSFADYCPYKTSEWFRGCSNLEEIKGISNLNTEYVTDMRYMFYGCSSLTNLDVSGFKTDKVKDMRRMFSGCSSLTSLDVSGFKTDSVMDVRYMFSGCSSLTNLDVSGFKTDNVTDMRFMFYGCSNLTSLDVSGFKTDSVMDVRYMFSGCSSLTSLNVSGFKTDNVTSMGSMFEDCSSLTSLDVSGFKTGNATDMRYMFYGCSSLTSLDVSGFKTGNATSMICMFYGCSSLTSLDVSGFKTDNVTSMGCMFYDCSSLTSLDLSSFKTDNVTSMYCMFYGCSSLTIIYAGNGWSTGNVTLDDGMFYNCINLVGGQGTVYDSGHTDHTYARFDDGTDAPGYFTYKASSGIKGITMDSTIEGNVPVYDIGGRRLAAPQKGINIVRMSDGTTKKIVIK